MKKHNEGYTLPLVLVVMVVLTIVASSVLSISLSNLKAQQADITRMQAQYALQGEVEEVVAKIDVELHALKTGSSSTVEKTSANVYVPVVEAIQKALSVPEGEQAPVKLVANNGIDWTSHDNGNFSCSVSMYTVGGDAGNVVCTILLENVITLEDNLYRYQAPEIIYTSYELGGGAE